MNKYQRRTNYLQQLSKRQHKAKEIIRISKEIVYPDDVDFEEVRMIIAARTFDKFGGTYHHLYLLNRDERQDSFRVSFDDVELFKNRFNNIVINCTIDPLVMGQSEGFRFLAKHFHRVGRFGDH